MRAADSGGVEVLRDAVLLQPPDHLRRLVGGKAETQPALRQLGQQLRDAIAQLEGAAFVAAARDFAVDGRRDLFVPLRELPAS